jgi:hypothetical protein
MTRTVTFSAEIIGSLRAKVIAHNDANPRTRVKLGDLKKRYAAAYQGGDPHAHAMTKVDHYLARLSGHSLAKVENDHADDQPRDRDGRFTSKGGGEGAAHKTFRAAHRAAYIAGLTTSRPKSKVTPPKDPFNLPKRADKHLALQQSSAGYAAITSGVLPETRFENVGAGIRTLAAGASGIALAHQLSTPKGRRAAIATAGVMGNLGGRMVGGAVGVPLHIAAGALETIERAYPQIAGRTGARAVRTAAHKTSYAGKRVLGTGLGAAGALGARVVGGAVNIGMNAMRAREMTTPVAWPKIKGWRDAYREVANPKRLLAAGRLAARTTGRKIGAKVLIGAGLGYGVNRLVQGTPMDPAAWGKQYDTYFPRIVLKMDGAAAMELQKAVVADLGPDGMVLAKDVASSVGRMLYTPIGRAIVSSGMAAGASLLGAGAGAAAGVAANRLSRKRGNPYHDSHGRFTSQSDAENSGAGRVKTAAAVGAAVAGIAAGALTHRGLTARNTALLGRFMAKAIKLHEGKLGRLEQLKEDLDDKSVAEDGPQIREFPHVFKKMDEQSDFVDKEVAKDKQLKEATHDLARYGSASPYDYKERLRSEINEHIASFIHPLDDAQVVIKGKPYSMVEARRFLPRGREIKHLATFIDQTSAKDAEKIGANLLPEEQATLHKWFSKRADVPRIVDDLAKKHIEDTTAAEAAVKASQDLVDEKGKALAVINAKLAGLNPESKEREPLAEEYKKAQEEHTDARHAADEATKALTKLKEKGLRARSMVTAEWLPKLTQGDLQARLGDLKKDATARAHQKFMRSELPKAFSAEAASLTSRHLQRLASYAKLGLSRDALGPADRDAGLNLHRAAMAHDAATDALAKAKGDLRAIRSELASVNGRLKNMKSSATIPSDGRSLDQIDAAITTAKKERASVVSQMMTLKTKETAGQLEKLKNRLASIDEAIGEHEKQLPGALRGLKGELEKDAERLEGDVNEAQAAHEMTRARLITAAHHPFGVSTIDEKGRAMMPPTLRAAVMRDVMRGARIVGDPINRFLVKPTRQHLGAALANAPAFIKEQWNAMPKRLQSVWRGLTQVPVTNAAGNVTYQYHWPKISALAGSLPVFEIARQYRHWIEHQTGMRDDAPKAVTVPKVINHVDPLSGEGYLAVTMPDAKNKGDHIILWGERYSGHNFAGTPIYSGARESLLRQRLAEEQAQRKQNQNQGGGNSGQLFDLAQNAAQDLKPRLNKIREAADDLGKQGKLVPLSATGQAGFSLRKQDETEKAAEADDFMRFLKERTLNSAPTDGGQFYAKLRQIFSSQGRVLRASDIAKLATGYGYKGGQHNGKPGLVPNDEGYGSTDPSDVVGAMNASLSHIMTKFTPRNDEQKNNVKRLFAAIGDSRSIPAPRMEEIFKTIDGGSSPAVDGATERAAQAAPGSSPNSDSMSFTDPDRRPSGGNWNESHGYAQGDKLAREIGKSLALTDEGEQIQLSDLIQTLGRHVYESYRGRLSQDASMDAAKRALLAITLKDPVNPGRMIQSMDYADFQPYLKEEAARKIQQSNVQKSLDGVDLDDFEGLLRKFSGVPPQPKPPKAPGMGAMPKPPALPKVPSIAHLDPLKALGTDERGVAAASTTEFLPRGFRSLGRQTEQKALGAQFQPTQYHPLADTSSAAADLAAGTLAGKVVGHALKIPESKSIFGGLSTAKSAFVADGLAGGLKMVGKLGVKGLASGIVGNALYNSVNHALGGQDYRRNSSPGEGAAMAVGNLSGSFAGAPIGEKLGEKAAGKIASGIASRAIGGDLGTAAGDLAGGPLGGVVGDIAGQAIGGALGEALGHFGFKAFAGHDPARVQRIMKTPLTPSGGALGETIGGTIGQIVGGQKLDEAASAIGSAVGNAAQNSQPLPRRPMGPQSGS